MVKSRKRVLLVDDEEDLTWSISKNLKRNREKFEVICANSGKEALEVLLQMKIDVVVTDIRMPGITGLELLLEIKEKYSHIKVIIMTAFGSPDYKTEALEKGCIYYLEKPFEIADLQKIIIDSLNEKRGFVGQISDFELTDIIQMNCLARITTALYIEHEDKKGSIFFNDGNIIHATMSDLKGENAFFSILSWNGGQFSTTKNSKMPEKTIYKNWQSLLLEGMKRVDEEKIFSKKSVRGAELYKKEINNLSNLKGVKGAFVLDNQFVPLLKEKQKKNLADSEVNKVINSLIILKNSLEASSSLFQAKHFETLSLKYTESHIHLTQVASSSFYILIIAEQHLNIAKLTIQLKRSLKTLIKDA